MKSRTCLGLALILVMVAPPGLANLDREQIEDLVAAFETAPPENFESFLERLSGSPLADPQILTAIDSYQQQSMAEDGRAQTMYRLLGLYTRLRYGAEAQATLAQLVAIPTFRQDGVPQHENPAFLQFATELELLATRFGLQFRNVDNRVYEVTLPGADPALVAFHAHADVVPANPDLWVLDDGTQLDPFQVTPIGDRLYGRGTEDDKNGIVVSLYAMRVIKEENLALSRTLRLLVDTTEETSGDAMPYYFESNPVPGYNIALDGGYPVIIAEKGFGTVMATFPVRDTAGEGASIQHVSGGQATNQIPAASEANLTSDRPQQLVAAIQELAPRFIADNGGDFGIAAAVEEAGVTLLVEGVSAHSSEPWTGVNPVAPMLKFLALMHARGLVGSNHYTDAAYYASDNWGIDYLGSALGIGYQDDFMGPFTAMPTLIAENGQRLQLAVNLRLPVGREPATLLQQIDARLGVWASAAGVAVNLELSAAEPMYRNPEGAWVNALLDVATQTLALPREFGSSPGATSIHDLPNGVQFGLALPTEKYTGHTANEFKNRGQFLLDLQIITEAMARLGTMGEL